MHAKIAEARQAIAQGLLDKKKLLSPEAGMVTNIRYFTPGSGIAQDQPIR